MKSIFFLLALVSLATAAYAQNTFPSSGNVGIGTTNPQSKLDLGGGGGAKIRIYEDGGTDNKGGFGTDMSGSSYELSAYFGSSANGHFSVGSWNGSVFSEKMRVTSVGNVGLCTSSPRSRLDIGTDLGVGHGARFGDYLEINEREYINNALSIGWNACIAANDGTYQPVYAPGSGMVLAMESGGNSNLDFWGRNWGGSSESVSLGLFTHVMRLSTNGNVGIGTTSPTQKLHVVGQYPQAVFGGLDSGGTNGLFIAGCSTLDKRNWLIGCQYNIDQSFEITPSTSNGGRIFSIPAFLVNSSGNVGIGTTSPSEKLSVNGRIRAKEVIVETTGWSDHVFTDSYQLPSLSEIEQHIKAEKHLPGVPSAQEVAEKGVSIGDMQAVLLAKIEELTLHVIEQGKRLDQATNKLEAQAAEIASLKAENAQLRR